MELPEWVHTIHGFDPDRPWLPIVCTGRGTHQIELLDVYFDHSEGSGWHYTARNTRLSRNSRPNPDGPGWMNDGPGSRGVECPVCGWTLRVSRADWSPRLDAARRAELPYLDVSQG